MTTDVREDLFIGTYNFHFVTVFKLNYFTNLKIKPAQTENSTRKSNFANKVLRLTIQVHLSQSKSPTYPLHKIPAFLPKVMYLLMIIQ